MTDRRGGRGWVRLAVRLCLLTWPRHARRRDGAEALATILEALSNTPGDRLRRGRFVVGECGTLLGAGYDMRRRAFLGGLREIGAGWTGDLRVALRGLHRGPGFTITAILTLAIGIGGNAAVFGLVDQIFNGPSPYASPDDLLLVWNTLGDDPARVGVAAPDVAIVRERARLLQGIAFMSGVVDGGLEDDAGGAAEHVRVGSVSPDFFQLLGVTPALGRLFGPDDGPSGGGGDGQRPAAVVLSDEIWHSSFAADRGVVGRTLRLDGRPVRVVGVLAPDFSVELPPDAGVAADGDLWVPLDVALADVRRADGRRRDQDSDNTGVTVARVRVGASVSSAVAEVADIGRQLEDEIPGYAAAGIRLDARPMRDDATAHASGLARALSAGGLILLLVACLNISTLILARGLGRRGEFAVRAAIGAGRGRLLRALVTESLVLIVAGIAAAVVVASTVSGILVRAMPPALAAVSSAVWSGEVLGAAGALTGVLILAVASAPAFSLGSRLEAPARLDTRSGRSGARSGRPGSRSRGIVMGARGVLVLSQLALSVLLVLGSTLLMNTASELSRTRPGFEPAGVLTFSLSLRIPGRYTSPAARARLMRETEDAIESIQGVTAVGLVGELPLAGGRWTQPYGLPGQAEHEWEANRADFRVVTSRYFDALGVRITEGRSFTRQEDLSEDRRVVIVDEKLASRIAPNGSVVGAQIGFPLDGSAVTAEVVGVVEHVRNDNLGADGREALYVPYRQEASRDVSFVVRADRSPGALAPAVRAKVREIDPQVPVYDVRTMQDYVEAQIAPTRFALTLVGAFGLLTLLAAAIGLYGVIAFEVARRTRDIGLRMAIGASGRDVLGSFLLGGLRLGMAGIAAGCLVALVIVVVFAPWFAEVPVLYPGPWIVTGVVVLAVTMCASWVPARRASRLDPRAALRVE